MCRRIISYTAFHSPEFLKDLAGTVDDLRAPEAIAIKATQEGKIRRGKARVWTSKALVQELSVSPMSTEPHRRLVTACSYMLLVSKYFTKEKVRVNFNYSSYMSIYVDILLTHDRFSLLRITCRYLLLCRFLQLLLFVA